MDYTDGQSFVRYFENIRSRTTRVIECIPRDKLDWNPVPGSFSFADLGTPALYGLISEEVLSRSQPNQEN